MNHSWGDKESLWVNNRRYHLTQHTTEWAGIKPLFTEHNINNSSHSPKLTFKTKFSSLSIGPLISQANIWLGKRKIAWWELALNSCPRYLFQHCPFGNIMHILRQIKTHRAFLVFRIMHFIHLTNSITALSHWEHKGLIFVRGSNEYHTYGWYNCKLCIYISENLRKLPYYVS